MRRTLGDTLTPHEQKSLVRRAFQRICMYAVELMRLPILTAELSERLVEQRGFEALRAALERGKGAILVATHMDNVDLAGCSMSARGLPMCVVAREPHSKGARAFVRRVREQTGVTLIPPKRSREQIKQLLADNRVVTLVVDQHLRMHQSIVCEFFGQLAATSPAPAKIALETGAPLFAGVMYRVGMSGRHVVRVEPEIELETPHGDLDANIRHNTQRLNELIESWVREFPEQWLWAHRRFKVHDDARGWDVPPALQHLVRPPKSPSGR